MPRPYRKRGNNNLPTTDKSDEDDDYDAKDSLRSGSLYSCFRALIRLGTVAIIAAAAFAAVESNPTQRIVSTDGTAHASNKHKQPLTCKAPKTLSVSPTGNLTEFIDSVFEGLNQVVVHKRPIHYVVEMYDTIPNTIDNGNWLEFGVFNGASLKMCYEHLRLIPAFRGQLFGFDSFQGLPDTWRGDFGKGRFATDFERVRAGLPGAIGLYEGWFQDTLPQYIQEHHPNHEPLAFVHHDGDLFVSTAIAFQMLGTLVRPGTILCFDELVGYPGYEKHEMLSLFLWMHQYHATLCPLAVMLPYRTAEERKGEPERPGETQSACFQVLEME